MKAVRKVGENKKLEGKLEYQKQEEPSSAGCGILQQMLIDGFVVLDDGDVTRRNAMSHGRCFGVLHHGHCVSVDMLQKAGRQEGH
eukprot:scaffold160343_cov35-Tisochrysis_lutea.AAC.1